MEAAALLELVRARTETLVRERYLDHGPLMRLEVDELCAAVAGVGRVTVRGAVELALRGAAADGRYMTEADRVWARVAYGWDLLTGAGVDPVARCREWGRKPHERIPPAMRESVVRGHARGLVEHVATHVPDQAAAALPLALWAATGADRVDLYRAMKLLKGLPAPQVLRLLLGGRCAPATDSRAVDLAGTVAAVLSPAAS